MKLVHFTSAQHTFAVDVRQVHEVIRIDEVVPLPNLPEWVEGIIHLRGEVVPLVNLRKKLRLYAGEIGEGNRVIVSSRGQGKFGVVVDSVIGVVTIDAGSVSDPDDIIRQATCIVAVADLQGQLTPILDLESLLSDQESHGLLPVPMPLRAPSCPVEVGS